MPHLVSHVTKYRHRTRRDHRRSLASAHV